MSAMALAVAVPPDNGEADARPRLLLACILSAMLHLLVRHATGSFHDTGAT